MQKQYAINALKTLNIYKPYIDGFAKKGRVCFFERFAGFWVDQEPEIEAKMKEIEQEHGCIVYAITHEFTSFGECWSFLMMSQYEEEWEMTLEELKDGYAFAYVWNKDDDLCSEFGTIVVKSFGGGITRIG